MSPPNILAEFKDVGKTRRAHLGGNRSGGQPCRLRPHSEKPFDQLRGGVVRRERHVDPQLEAPPNGPIKQLGMVGRCHHHDIARELVELHEQERNNALNLAGLMDIAAFLADRVELIEEQDARGRPHIFEQAGEPRICLTKIGANQRIVPHREQGQRDRLGDGLGERSLAVARGTRQKDPVARLHALRAQEVGAVLLLYQLAGKPLGRKRQDKAVERDARL